MGEKLEFFLLTIDNVFTLGIIILLLLVIGTTALCFLVVEVVEILTAAPDELKLLTWVLTSLAS